MQAVKSILRRAVPMSCRRLVQNALAKWKSRKFVSTRRALKSLGKVDAHWRQRIDDALACPDNRFIERVPDAGQLVDGVLTMHNGIRVGGLGYCGAGVLNMLVDNRGVHEPQEERAFGDVLKHVPAGGVMLELGAYWGFYSLWFTEEVADANCHLLEPHPTNIRSGQINFKLNNRHATFDQAYAGACDGTASDGVPTVTVDSHCRQKGIARLAILHADIQGAEADMLHGAADMLAARKIDFLFISTHSNDLHGECVGILNSHRYTILASADLDETYSVDGLIVARGPHLAAPRELTISTKSRRVQLR
ncbi:MAG: hypothetical protein CMJ64_14270 [Planctomycetaceae bacterium]|nr:hypothetical protein [Planctomycetaceae bacterium]